MGQFTLEMWRAVPLYVGLYEVSHLGRVMSLPRNTTSGGILKPLQGGNKVGGGMGHLAVQLYVDGTCDRWYVHRLVMAAFTGPCPEGQEVRHLDGNPHNNRWASGDTEEEIRANGGNLIYGTHRENILDIVRSGEHYLASRTHCNNGHEFTPENTYIDAKGARICRTCNRDYQREYQKEWRKRNPEKHREYDRTSKEKKKRKGGSAA